MKRPVTVLVIEADHHVRVWTRRALEDAGYRVVTVTDGQAAFAELRKLDPLPALILIDLSLPLMDGRDVIALLRGRPGWSAIPIVLLTTADLDLVPGSLAVIRKDSTKEELLKTVRRYCL